MFYIPPDIIPYLHQYVNGEKSLLRLLDPKAFIRKISYGSM